MVMLNFGARWSGRMVGWNEVRKSGSRTTCEEKVLGLVLIILSLWPL